MLKKTRLLTRPTLASRDAPCPKQARSSAADPRFTFHVSRLTFHGSWERGENTAGGLFQHPARDVRSLRPLLGRPTSAHIFTLAYTHTLPQRLLR
jgi:hypothetical protein